MLRSEADNMPLFPIPPVRLPVQTAPGCPSGHCRILSRAAKRYTHPKILRSQSGYNTLGFFHIPDNFLCFPMLLLLWGSVMIRRIVTFYLINRFLSTGNCVILDFHMVSVIISDVGIVQSTSQASFSGSKILKSKI